MTSTRLQNSSIVSSGSTGYSTIRSVESENHETRQQKLDFIVNRFNSIPNHGRGKNPLTQSERAATENSNFDSEPWVRFGTIGSDAMMLSVIDLDGSRFFIVVE